MPVQVIMLETCHDGDVPRGIYIGWIVVDPSVDLKICGRAGGGCTASEVCEAFQGRSDVELKWKPDTAPVEVAGFGVTTEGKRIFAAFLAIDERDGTWALKSAWPV